MARPTPRPGVATRPSPTETSPLRLVRVQRALDSHPLPWARCLIAIVSYGLLMTDTLRTGLAITALPKAKPIDPNVYHYYGPYSYRVIHLSPANVTSTMPVAIWSYKYDSTSIILRGLVKTLNMEDDWPACATYRLPRCDELTGLPRATVFSMLDRVIQRVQDHRSLSSATSSVSVNEPQKHILLRIENTWKDRLHEVLLSSFFAQSMQRTGQVLTCLEREPPSSTKFPATCDPKWRELWPEARPAWRYFSQRLRLLRRTYPNATFESLILQGVDDVERSAVLFHGQQDIDLVLLTRVRICGDLNCTTVAIDDCRYESAVYLTSVLDWKWIIGLLRGAGQFYTWLRLVSLIMGVHHMMQALPNSTWKTMVRTLFLIPSQVVIYGSVFPIICYTVAFVLDSPVQNELIRNHFSTPLGKYKLNMTQALTISSIAMRSVWLIALCGHLLVSISTRRSWSAMVGVIGIPEFFMTMLASATVVARLRVRSWRNSNVVEVEELPWSDSLAASRKLRLHNPTNGLMELTTSAVDGQSIDAE
ncbi:hypothetical protein P43SY_005150 [Pythium insidiosum]|uniref:Transmembrane protein n=1 Tax=Pythium insidiosum TaxID=114742 RepID=A0AAD5Q5N3_PYTIN|nr:hypothetical protein P43SY_005150 [Pythium insidiosum]